MIGAAPDLGQGRHRHIEQIAQVRPPLQRLQVHQARAAGVGGVGHVAGPAVQLPDQPGVDGAQLDLAPRRPLPRARHGVQEPGVFRGREIGVEDQAGRRLHLRLMPFRRQPRGHVRRAAVLPDDGPVQWLAGRASQSTVVSRWLVMPTAANRCGADPLSRTAAGRQESRAKSRRHRARPSRERGKCWANSIWLTATALNEPDGDTSNAMARVEVVPWSMARIRRVMTRGSSRFRPRRPLRSGSCQTRQPLHAKSAQIPGRGWSTERAVTTRTAPTAGGSIEI